MRSRASLLLLTLPLAALSLACGDSGNGLPTGSWHPGSGGTIGGGTTGGGGPASNGSNNGGSSSSGGTASSGGSNSSGGGTTSSGGSSSSGASSSGASSSGSGSSGSSGSSSSSGGQAAPNLTVSVDHATMSSQLMASSTVTVSVAPNGFSGMATLSLPSMPSGVTGSFDNATLSLDGRTTATATLTLKTADSAAPGAANIEVDAMAAGSTFKATLALTVESVITVHIPKGVDSMGGSISNPVTTAYGPYPMKIAAPTGGISAQNPVTVYFFNDDTVSHEIHASDDQEGFAHDPGPIAPMSMDSLVRNVNTAGSYNWYLHDQGAPITVGLITIQ